MKFIASNKCGKLAAIVLVMLMACSAMCLAADDSKADSNEITLDNLSGVIKAAEFSYSSLMDVEAEYTTFSLIELEGECTVPTGNEMLIVVKDGAKITNTEDISLSTSVIYFEGAFSLSKALTAEFTDCSVYVGGYTFNIGYILGSKITVVFDSPVTVTHTDSTYSVEDAVNVKVTCEKGTATFAVPELDVTVVSERNYKLDIASGQKIAIDATINSQNIKVGINDTGSTDATVTVGHGVAQANAKSAYWGDKTLDNFGVSLGGDDAHVHYDKDFSSESEGNNSVFYVAFIVAIIILVVALVPRFRK